MKIVTTLHHSSLQKVSGMVCGMILLCGMVAYTLQTKEQQPIQQIAISSALETAASAPEVEVSSKTEDAVTEEANAGDSTNASDEEALLAAPVFQWSEHVSSAFGSRDDPLEEGAEDHLGIDIAVNEGTAVFAAMDGVVSVSQTSDTGYGNEILLDHENGVQTRYAHCSALLCSEGDTVEKGDLIALVGNTGDSTGPHLHFEVLENGEAVDPTAWLSGE